MRISSNKSNLQKITRKTMAAVRFWKTRPAQTDKITSGTAGWAITPSKKKFPPTENRHAKEKRAVASSWEVGRRGIKWPAAQQYTHVKHKCRYPISSLELSMVHVLFFRLRKSQTIPAV
jgi:hypothetical protein